MTRVTRRPTGAPPSPTVHRRDRFNERYQVCCPMSVNISSPVLTSQPISPNYALTPDGAFCITHYDAAPAFSSFLPGIAGFDGAPLWCLYVNRAQAIASFGVHNKDNAIVEFLPANWAYQLVGVQGFRTFCMVNGEFYEPFSANVPAPTETRTMRVRPDRLQLTALDTTRGLQCDVEYFTPPERSVGALVRHMTLTNVGTTPVRIAVLDGLPLILPAGVRDGSLKEQRHITAAYAYVQRLTGDVPFFATKVAVHDEAEVSHVACGNFYAAWHVVGRKLRPVQPIIDPDVVFGAGQGLTLPRCFIESERVDRTRQVWENRLACALVPVTAELAPHEAIELFALVGAAPSAAMAEHAIQAFATRADFAQARDAGERVVADVTAPAAMISSQPLLDAYARQNYLDNVLRGGVPLALPSQDGTALLHVFARRHGDLERDYNYFVLPPHPLSSGAGNYRDICQNRRWDAFFYADVRDLELRAFLELLQADGYNPLGIAGYHWRADADRVADCAPEGLAAAQLAEFRTLVTKPFQPGAVLHWLDRHGITLPDRMAWLRQLLGACRCQLVAAGHEGGYWIDHWTYITDLLDALAYVYPDELETMLTAQADVGWFDEGAFVQPRRAKYQRRPAGLRQLDAVADRTPRAAPLPKVTPLGKLAALIAIKAVSFDANCRGLEMEAGRPGWNDAMNGLPGLCGSSMCEALALGRLAQWLRDRLPHMPNVVLPRVVADLLTQATAHLAADAFDWSAECATREAYREALAHGTDDATAVIAGPQLARLLELVVQRVTNAAARATDAATGLTHTYFRNTSPSLPPNPADAVPSESTPLPLFLEGQVHRLRLTPDPAQARQVYAAVRDSALFDRALQMYKLNAPLVECSQDIGRARTFTPGWFENESIWLHMSYKYLLELLRAGLHAEFFRDASTMLVPFMDPRTYGRSVLENSSFIGSSANPDPATHGRGFIARLSGSTAEFIHMWLLMTLGPQPFRQDADGQLAFAPQPALPGEWFTTARTTVAWGATEQVIPAHAFGCALLGHTLLVYHNAERRDTFGPDAVHPVRYQVDGGAPINAATLGPADALRLRDRQVARLDVWLA